MRSLLIAGLAAVSLTCAGPAAAEPSAENLDLARRYANALHMENIMGNLMRSLMPAMMDRLAKTSGGDVTAELKEAFASAADQSARAMTPKMLDIMVPVIADSFSTEELKAAVDYYEGPAAQSLLAKMPVYTARVTPQLMELTPEIEADMQRRICAEIGCEAK